MKQDYVNKIGFIYKLTSPNGKIYIGQTINKKQRKYHYKNRDFKAQIKLYNNVLKYDWIPSETFEIVEEVLCGYDKEFLNEREKYWIKHYNSFKDGLNCNDGGCGNLGYKFSDDSLTKMSLSKIGVKHPEWRNKQKSEYTKGRVHTEESKKKMSLVKTERMNDEIKLKISKGLLGNKNGVGNKGGSKKIICLTNNVIYDSIKSACDELGLHSDGIIKTCKGIFKQTKGYIFKYYE